MEDTPRDIACNERQKYICTSCRYNFIFRHGTAMALRCPNCGKDNVLADDFDLSRLIDDV